MDEWPLWVGAYLGIGAFAGLLRLPLLAKTGWPEYRVTLVCRFGPAAILLLGLLAATALSPPQDPLFWGLLSLLLPTFIVPLVGVCYLGVWASAFLWPERAIRKDA